jgi:hypothetical protein
VRPSPQRRAQAADPRRHRASSTGAGAAPVAHPGDGAGRCPRSRAHPRGAGRVRISESDVARLVESGAVA